MVGQISIPTPHIFVFTLTISAKWKSENLFDTKCQKSYPFCVSLDGSTANNSTKLTMPLTKKHTLMALLILVVLAVIVVPATLYWHSLHPWQHVVNLDYFYQAKIAVASPHDADPRNNLAQLPAGYRIIDGVRFNVAGLIQLAGGDDIAQTNNPYAASVEGIPVNRFCQQLHLIHGMTGDADNQTLAAKLVLHYGDGTTADLNIVRGQQVYGWWFKGDGNPPLAGNTKVAWIGDNPTAKRAGYRIWVFKTSFANPKPNMRIETVDYVSGLAPDAGPFLLALTVE